MRFLNDVCKMQFNPLINPHAERVSSVYFHTSHPALCGALRRDRKWVQVSQSMGKKLTGVGLSGKGDKRPKLKGHLRAVQGYKMQRALKDA